MSTEPTTENPEPQPGSPEYDQMMIERSTAGFVPGGDDPKPAEPAPADPPKVDPMPEGGFDKFYDKETGTYDWQAHAKEAEFKLTQKGKQESAPKGEDTQSGGEDTQTGDDTQPGGADDQVQDVITRAGLSTEVLQQELITTGGLTDDTVKALVEKGNIPEVFVREYVSLAVEKIQRNQADAIERAGGEAAFNAMSEWAKTGVSQSERDQINAMLKGPNYHLAIDILASRYHAANPGMNEPKRLTGQNGGQGGGGVAGFKSQKEMSDAINNPKYQTDEAYRAEVRQRIALM